MVKIPPMGGVALMAIGLAKLRRGNAPCYLHCGDAPMHRDNPAVRSWAAATREYYHIIDFVSESHADGCGAVLR